MQIRRERTIRIAIFPRRMAQRWIPLLLLMLTALSWCDGQGLPAPAVVFKGHTETIYSLVTGPNGKQIVSGSFDKTIRVWEAATGKELRVYAGPQAHQQMVLSVGINPDGSLIASGSSDNTARVWDFPMSEPMVKLAAGDGIFSLAVTPDGKAAAAGLKDGTIRLWKVNDPLKESFKDAVALKGHQGPVLALAFANNGLQLISGGVDGTLRSWNTADGKALNVLGAHTGSLTALLATGTQAYSSGEDGTIKGWNLLAKGPSKGEKNHASPVQAFAVSSDGTLAASAAKEPLIRVHSGEGFKTTKDYDTQDGQVVQLGLSQDKKWLIAGHDTGIVQAWNLQNGKQVMKRLAHPGGVASILFTPSGTQYLTVGMSGGIKVWPLPANPEPAKQTPLQEPALISLPAADGKGLFWAGAGKQFRLAFPGGAPAPENIGLALKDLPLCLAQKENLKALYAGFADGYLRPVGGDKKDAQIWGHQGKVTGLATMGGNLLSAGEDGYLRSFKTAFPENKLLPLEGLPTRAQYDAPSQRFTVVLNDGRIRIGKAPGTEAAKVLPKFTNAAQIWSLTADGNFLAWAAGDTVNVENLAQKKATRLPLKLPAAVKTLALRADGKQGFAGLADGKIAVLESEGKADAKLYPAHIGEVQSILQTGSFLLTTGADKSVKLLKAADFSPAASATLDSPIVEAQVSPSGKKLLLVCADKSIRLHDLPDLKAQGKIQTAGNVRSAAFDQEEKRVLAGVEGAGLVLFSLDGSPLEYFPTPDFVLSVGWSQDNTKAWAMARDKGIQSWSPSANWAVKLASPQRDLTVVPGKDLVVLAGEDGKGRFFKASDGKAAGEFALGGLAKKLVTSRDGSVLGCWQPTGQVTTWNLNDLQTGKSTQLGSFNLGPALNLALAPDGKQAAVSLEKEKGESWRLLDLPTGEEIFREKGVSPARALLFTDSRSLGVFLDNTVYPVDTSLGKLMPRGMTGVRPGAFGANETQLWLINSDKSVSRWDLALGKETLKKGPFTEDLTAVSVSADGQIGAVAAGKNARVWNTTDGKDLLVLSHPQAVTGVRFSPDKTRLATTCADGLIRSWDLVQGREQQAFLGAFAPSPFFHPQGAHLLAAGNDGAMHILPFANTRLLSGATPVRAMAYGPGQQTIWGAGDDKTLQSWNLGNGVKDKTLEASGNALRAVAFSPNNQLLATGGLEPEVRIFNAGDLKQVGAIRLPGAVRTLLFLKDQVLCAVSEDGSVQLLNVAYTAGQPTPPEFGKPVQGFSVGNLPTGANLSQDGKKLYTADASGAFLEWKIASDIPIRVLNHPNFVDAVAFKPNGPQLATGCHDGKIRLFDLEKGNQIREIDAHTKPAPVPVYAIAWTKDGNRLISCAMDGAIRAWDSANGQQAYEIKSYREKEAVNGHKDGVFTLAISPDQSLLATAGSDRIIKLWNLRDGSFVRDLVHKGLPNADKEKRSHPGWIYSVRFTPDGKQVVAVGGAPRGKGYWSQWRVADGTLVNATEVVQGVLYTMALSPDATAVTVASGNGQPGTESNQGFLLKVPGLK
ncbi:MAG: hypothetical protein EXR99_05540 [Gemmataceae bacterium]|nr:hypothetical protein [Gemmataceae bacterium]